jgi:hypothetical protein
LARFVPALSASCRDAASRVAIVHTARQKNAVGVGATLAGLGLKGHGLSGDTRAWDGGGASGLRSRRVLAFITAEAGRYMPPSRQLLKGCPRRWVLLPYFCPVFALMLHAKDDPSATILLRTYAELKNSAESVVR